MTLGRSRNGSGWTVIALALATAFSALISVANIGVWESMVKRAADNRNIEASFKRADRIVSAYKSRTGHLPSYSSDYPTPIGYVSIVDPSIAGWDGSDVLRALKTLGQPPKDAYLLTADWNEEPEFFAPWSGKSTLSFDPDYYSVSGRLWLDVAMTWLITAMLALAAVRAFVAWQPKRADARTRAQALSHELEIDRILRDGLVVGICPHVPFQFFHAWGLERHSTGKEDAA